MVEVLGKKPHPKQEGYLRDNHQKRVMVAGRRAGKSTAAAVATLHRLLTNPGYRKMHTSYTQDQAMIVFEEIEGMIQDADLGSEIASIKHSPFGEIVCTNGAIYRARGAQHRGKYLRGRGYHEVDMDEAGLVPDDTVDGAIMPMLIDYDGQINKYGTPWGRNHLYQGFLEGGGEGDKPEPGAFSTTFTSFDNPNISARFIRKVLAKGMSPLKYDTEILAKFSDDVGRAFAWQAIQRSYNIDEPIIPKGARGVKPAGERAYVMGWDLARHLDWTVGVVLDVTDPADLKIVWKDRFQKQPWDYVVSAIRRVAQDYHVVGAAIDATGLGDPIVDRLIGDFPLDPFKFTVDSKQALINNLKANLEEGRLHFDYWEDLVDELRFYSYELSQRSHHVLMGTQSEHDDCVTALALAMWAFTNAVTSPKISVVG